jgi:hypothetical protein
LQMNFFPVTPACSHVEPVWIQPPAVPVVCAAPRAGKAEPECIDIGEFGD